MAEWKPFDRRNGTYHLLSDLYQEYSSNKTSQRPNDPFHGPSSELSQNDPFYAPNNPTGGSDVPIRLKRFSPVIRRATRDKEPEGYGGNGGFPIGSGLHNGGGNGNGGGLPTARFDFNRVVPRFNLDPNGISRVVEGGPRFDRSPFPPISQVWSNDNAGIYPPSHGGGGFNSAPLLDFEVRGTSVAARRMNFPVKQTSIVSRRMNAPLGKTGTGVFIPKIDPTETSTRRKTKPTSTGPKREERQRQKKLSQPEKHMITGQSSSKDWTYSP
ncbi:hypothetical protein ZOSMA_196G00170 [Zostera marina]|uniref:Uncharacterized protein n=1 Tax=Zostera marina TaxID=29655 RepID=A0A0K9PNP3_ZOSMR|nr:hypothetical protein ZOSMA_196G00170 [Zostera marina]